MKRDIKAIVATHIMDPVRKELYVEGRRDKLFFDCLVRTRRNPNIVIHEIDSVEIDVDLDDDNRAKLLYFANSIIAHRLAVRCFADADFDRILQRAYPANVWLTDGRDLEGYVLQIACIEKVLLLAMRSENLDPQAVLDEVRRHARPLGVLRLLSAQRDLKLPFKRKPIKPYVKRTGSQLTMDFEGYLRSLLQGTDLGLRALDRIRREHSDCVEATRNVNERELLHGKDCMALLSVLLRTREFVEAAVEPSFWASIETQHLRKFVNLSAALEFLSS